MSLPLITPAVRLYSLVRSLSEHASTAIHVLVKLASLGTFRKRWKLFRCAIHSGYAFKASLRSGGCLIIQ